MSVTAESHVKEATLTWLDELGYAIPARRTAPGNRGLPSVLRHFRCGRVIVLIVLLKRAYEVIDTGAERPCYPLGGIRANILSATAFQTCDDRVANAGLAGKFPLREFAPCA